MTGIHGIYPLVFVEETYIRQGRGGGVAQRKGQEEI